MKGRSQRERERVTGRERLFEYRQKTSVDKKMKCCVGPRSKAGTETEQTNVSERKMWSCINTLVMMMNEMNLLQKCKKWHYCSQMQSESKTAPNRWRCAAVVMFAEGATAFQRASSPFCSLRCSVAVRLQRRRSFTRVPGLSRREQETVEGVKKSLRSSWSVGI